MEREIKYFWYNNIVFPNMSKINPKMATYNNDIT